MSYLDNTGVAYLWSKIKAAFAAKSHTHAAGDVTSGTLPVARGGTGAATAAVAVENIVDGQHIKPLQISATNSIYTSDGNISTSKGDIRTFDGDIRTFDGDVFTTDGDVIIKSTDGTTDLHKLSEKANTGHKHSADDITSGTLPIARGGTGATTAADAVANIVDGQDIKPQKIYATGDIYTSNGSIRTDNGNVTVYGGRIYARDGGISTYSGNIFANGGNIYTYDNGDVIVKSADGLTDLHKLSEKANTGHKHSADDITSGTLPIGRGGTGQSGLVSEYVVANVATAGTGCSILGVQYHQWGKVAQLYIGIRCTSAKNSGDVLATIAAGKRPVMTTPLANLANASQFCAVYNNGQVQAKSSLTTGAEVYVIGTYLLS